MQLVLGLGVMNYWGQLLAVLRTLNGWVPKKALCMKGQSGGSPDMGWAISLGAM